VFTVTTKLDGALKREIMIGADAYTLTLDGEGLKLTMKGKRNGLQLSWANLLNGHAATASAGGTTGSEPPIV
jgi:hypothetical protein